MYNGIVMEISLNTEQKKAVDYEGGPILIVAGAGTGKTRVITERIKWLIESKKARPSEILALTFTEKAAAEMLDRVDVAMPLGYEEPWLSTFHSFAERILREEGLEIGLDTSYKILTPPQAWLFVRQNLFEFDLKYYRPLGNPTKFISAMLTLFSRAQDEDVSPEEFVKYAEGVATGPWPAKIGDDKQTKGLQLPSSPSSKEETEKTLELARAYQTYQNLKIENSFMDFGDLISWTLKLFRERPSVLKKYQDQFKYILVDEFQDTNYAQYQLIKLLAPSESRPELMTTGDDDQCLPPGTLVTTLKGSKKIERIKRGEEIITAVGKGHTSTAKVTKIFRNRRKRRLLTFLTEGGKKITVTDNHKMFCFIPPVPKKKDRYFVYLMQQRNIGWRLGITNDLAARLRIEHHADRIVGIGSFPSETEARYQEIVYSLKYAIPTICFTERPSITIKGKWLEKLYQEFDTEKGAKRLAKDLNIDLDAHHFAVDGVTRGQTQRVKINLMLCGRRYRSKWSQDGFLANPSVYHTVYLETSDSEIIKKLKKAGFPLQQAKKGMRYRFQSTNLREVGQKAERLQKATDGIIDHKFSVGTTNVQHCPARVMPAKNILVGHYLPVLMGRKVIYDRVASVQEQQKEVVTYDLEVGRTHNFVANGVVVHNSIYKFRGASVSNILEFKKDYPEAETVVLTKNYRSGQKILNAVYQLIQNNNPDRLEEKLGIGKQLERIKNQPARPACRQGRGGQGIKDVGPEIIHTATGEKEAEEVVAQIVNCKSQIADLGWRDFAILARANNHLDPFVAALKRHGIPYQLIGNRGLFDQGEIRDVVAILKVLANPEDDVNLYRLLNIDVLKTDSAQIGDLLNQARRKRESLFNVAASHGSPVIDLIKKHRQDIAKKSVTLLAFNFLDKIGYVRPLLEEESIENQLKIKNLNLFFDKIKEFESEAPEPNVLEFVNYLDLMIEAGESPAQAEIEDIDTVNLLTVHAAKGLEFPVVFLVNLVSDRFPTRNRKDKLPLPDALVKETLPEGNAHIQEERRLFYVGCTRAKEGLFLSWADNYGGKRLKKPSSFLKELGVKNQESRTAEKKTEPLSLFDFEPQTSPIPSTLSPKSQSPKFVSYSQLETFSQCPLKYKYRYVLRLPTPPSHTLSFGQTIHRTLRDFHREDLFKSQTDVNRLLELYQHHWLPEGYESKEHQQKRFEEGEVMLKQYFEKHKKLLGEPVQLEKKFTLRVGGIPLIGSIDRVDELPGGGFEIVDYKTGKVREQKYVDRDDQLTIYALGAKAALGIEPQSLALYFVNENKKVSTTRTPEQLEKKRQEIEEKIEEIKESQFEPKTSRLCKWCPYKNLCPDYKQNLF